MEFLSVGVWLYMIVVRPIVPLLCSGFRSPVRTLLYVILEFEIDYMFHYDRGLYADWTYFYYLLLHHNSGREFSREQNWLQHP